MIDKEEKEKIQVEKIKEAKNVKIEKTLVPKSKEKIPPIDTKIELKDKILAKSATPSFYLIFQAKIETISQMTYNV